METLKRDRTPTDLPEGAEVRRPDPARPYVAMSNRKRWGKCALSAVLPQLKTQSGPSAEEGTEAHKVAEWALERKLANMMVDCPVVDPPPGLPDFDYSADGIKAWRHTLWEYATAYAARAAGLFADCTMPTKCLVEHKVEDVTIHGVRVFTVADVVLWNAQARRLVVGDYKFGRGPVGMGSEFEPNEQVAGTLALLIDYGIPDCQTVYGGFVYQPRTHAGEPWQALAPLPRSWVKAERAKLDDELKAVAAAAADPDGTAPVPGSHCKYCPSVRWCPAAAEYGTRALAAEAGRIAVVDLSHEEVMAQWGARSAFKAYEDDLRERVRILAETRSPAVTVRKRAGNTIWKDPDRVVELLLLTDNAKLLQPAGVTAVRGSQIPVALIDQHTTRAPDVLTYTATAGKDHALAASGFGKYLKPDA